MKYWQMIVVLPVLVGTLAACSPKTEANVVTPPAKVSVETQANTESDKKSTVVLKTEADVDQALDSVDKTFQDTSLESDFSDLKDEDLGL